MTRDVIAAHPVRRPSFSRCDGVCSCPTPRPPPCPSAAPLHPAQAAGNARGAGPDIRHGKLANGLEIVVIPDHRAPVVTHMVWYRNGSADDPTGKSGIAHFLEHLMFKGTAKHPQGEFSDVVAELGGQENAFTSNDYTAYFQRVGKEHLATLMGFEADRMTNLVLTDEVVNPERDVVLEERLMRTDTDPDAQLQEAVQAALFAHHPYGKPIIGWKHEIREPRSAPMPSPITTASTRPRTPSWSWPATSTFDEVEAPGARHLRPRSRRAARRPCATRPQEPPIRAHRLVTLADPRSSSRARSASISCRPI